MNQTEATEYLAEALNSATYGVQSVSILTPSGESDLVPVILVKTGGGTHLSVTVETLAQP